MRHVTQCPALPPETFPGNGDVMTTQGTKQAGPIPQTPASTAGPVRRGAGHFI